MPITAHTSTTAPLMVDIPFPFFGKPKGTEKFIFNREGKLPLSISIKKYFWQKEMCLAAKNRVIELCKNEKFKEIKKVRALLSDINSPEKNGVVEVKESDVIDAFEGVVNYLIPAKLEDFKGKIPDDFIEQLNNNKKAISPEELIEDIKSIFNDNLAYISGLRGHEAFATLKIHLNKKGELKTAQAYSPLLDMLSAAIAAIAANAAITAVGEPDNPDREIILQKINNLHKEIQAIFDYLVEHPRANEIELLKTALLREIPFFSKNIENTQCLNTFLDYVNHPQFDFEQPQAHRNLALFLNNFYEYVHKLSPATRNLCLKEVDKLEGSLLMQEKAYLPRLSSPDLPADLRLLLNVLRKESRKNGPAASLFHLFQYAEIKTAAINKASYWFLSSLSEENILSLVESLPATRSKNYLLKIIYNLKHDLDSFKNSLNNEILSGEEKAKEKLDSKEERERAGHFEEVNSEKTKNSSKLQRIVKIMSRPNIFPQNSEARAQIILAVKSILNKLPSFRDDLHTKSELKEFINFMENQSMDFSDDEKCHHLEGFIISFFNEIENMSVDVKKLCMNEIDQLLGLQMANSNLNYDLIKIEEKILNNKKFDLATALQFRSAEIGPSACMTHFFHYLETGKDAIDARSYWTLTHLMRFQRGTIIHLLGPQQKSDFDALMGQLKTDLKSFKERDVLAT